MVVEQLELTPPNQRFGKSKIVIFVVPKGKKRRFKLLSGQRGVMKKKKIFVFNKNKISKTKRETNKKKQQTEKNSNRFLFSLH